MIAGQLVVTTVSVHALRPCLSVLSECLSLAYLSAVFSASACTVSTLRSLLPRPSTAAAIRFSAATLMLGSPLRQDDVGWLAYQVTPGADNRLHRTGGLCSLQRMTAEAELSGCI